jgi:hypothetical protein
MDQTYSTALYFERRLDDLTRLVQSTTGVFTIRQGEWQIRIGNDVLPAIWNSRGAALAGLAVELRRRGDA